MANKIQDLGNSISLKYKTLLLQSLAILLFKQFQYSKEEIKQILDAILNPGKEKKERSTTPWKWKDKADTTEVKPLTTWDVFKLINFDNIMIGDYEIGKSSKQSVWLMGEESKSDESMILKRDD